MTLTAEQHEIRSRGIGGSDAAAALGFSRWKTPVKLYLEKLGEIDDEDRADGPLYWGQVLEDIVAKEYAKRTGTKVRRRNQAIFHKEHDFMLAHLDRSVDGERKVLECKTSSDYMADQWGPDGSDDVPDDYLIQCQHALACTGYESADLAVLIGNREFRIFKIPRDDALIDGMIDREREFWNCVLTRTPPPPMTAQDILDLYPVDNGEQVLAGEPEVATWRELVQLRALLKDGEAKKGELEDILKKFMEPASEIVDSEGRKLITWKKPKDSHITDWQAVARELVALHKIDPDDFQGTIEDHTATRVNSRRFLVKDPSP